MVLRSRVAAPYSPWGCTLCRLCTQRLARRSYSTPATSLPPTPTRSRFAPSPTGSLHLGSLRTALFNFLLARATGGKFLLRIEDTDRKRTVPGALESICRDLRWAGLDWDEGPDVGGSYGPYIQSERTPLYTKYANQLLESGAAYRCFCSAERLDELARKRSSAGLPTDYDRTCLGIPKEEAEDRAHKGERHIVRLKMPEENPRYEDLVYGLVGGAKGKRKKVTHGQQSYEDPVLLKSDGLPTYHLANVVDDHLMDITHVVRAVEWMPSTPKHLVLYDALGWIAPKFAHVGLLQDHFGKKLSKRDFDGDIATFREQGYNQVALLNFVALLGSSYTSKSDVLTIDELIKDFRFKFTKGNTIVSPKKLKFLQLQHNAKFIEQKCQGQAEEEPTLKPFLDGILERFDDGAFDGQNYFVPEHSYLQKVLLADSQNFHLPAEWLRRNKLFFTDALPLESYMSSWPSKLPKHRASNFGNIKQQFEKISASDWASESSITQAIDDYVKISVLSEETESGSDESQIKLELIKYLRWAVMGGSPGPPIALTIAILGRDRTLDRLEGAAQAGKSISMESA